MSFVPHQAIGLGVGPGDTCYDPNHPWWLPSMFHTAFECKCMTAENRDVEDQCVFAMPGGTPAAYSKPKNVPGIPQIIMETPANVARVAGNVVSGTVSGAATGAGQGIADNLDWKGIAVIVGLSVLGLTVLAGTLRR